MLCTTLCCLFVTTAAFAVLPPVTELEAVQIALHQVPNFYITEAKLKKDRYTLRGTDDEGPECVVVVDAIKSRVLTVSINGRTTYEFPGIQLAGHRATVKFAPENTLSAVKAAIEQGMHILELDVRETSDGIFVLMHDHTVDKTTDGTGPISQMTLEDARKLDAGSWFNDEFKGEPVPTLEEALDLMEGKAMPDIDFKAGDPKRLIALLEKRGLTGVTLYCGNWGLMRELQNLCSTIQYRPTVPWGREGMPRLYQEVNPPIVNINWRQFTEQLVRDAHIDGKKAFLNTMGPMDNAYAIQLAIDAGADYIQSDQIDVSYEVVKKSGLLAPPVGSK